MQIYIAIPRAIIGNENGKCIKSEPLGIFLVTLKEHPTIFGRKNIEFNEVISGRKLVNRNIEFDNMCLGAYTLVEDIDATIEKEQIGDVKWEILDKNEADRILSQQQLESYYSQSPNEILTQLNDIREKAKNIVRNKIDIYKLKGSKKTDFNKSYGIYIAIPRAIIGNENGKCIKSEPLGIFLVTLKEHPTIFGRKNIEFNEVISGRKLVNRNIEFDNMCLGAYTLVEDIDATIEKEQIGDVKWEILDKNEADRILSCEEYQNYMRQTKKEINDKISELYAQAIFLGRKNNKLILK